jgi:DNA-binding PadR family transcriptional regulator
MTPRKSSSDLPALPATAYAVLGLLSFDRELSGYDMKKWADTSLRFFYVSPAISKIYDLLKRLDSLGYVSSREVPQDELRNKRVYRLTPQGRQVLATWVEQADVEPPVLKHSPLLRVWLGHISGPAHIRELMLTHRANTEQMLTAARSARANAHSNPDWAYPEIVARFSVRHYEAELTFIDELLAELPEAKPASRRRRT